MYIIRELSTTYLGFIDKDLCETREEVRIYMSENYPELIVLKIVSQDEGWEVKFIKITPIEESFDE